MSEEINKILKAIIISGILLIVLCFGVYYRLTHKIDNYTKLDIQIIKGTLKQKPVLHRSAKGSATIEFELNEYENTVYSLGGIFLDPVDYDSFISENNVNDSIQISIPKIEDLGVNPEVLEIKTAKGEYLTLKTLNEILSKDKPWRDLTIYSLTAITFLIFIWKIVKLRKCIRNE